jgi:hypothetical protein
MHSLRALLLWAVTILAARPCAALAGEGPAERYLRAASQRDAPPLGKKAYEQLAQMHRGNYSIMSGTYLPGTFSAPPRPIDTSRIPPPHDAMYLLYNMGIDVLPVLTEALDDTTLSQTFRCDSHKVGYDGHNMVPIRTRAWKVNELVGMLICAIAERRFVIIEKGRRWSIVQVADAPALVPKFQKLVLNWYAKNAKKTQVQRKIYQISDDDADNSANAVLWLGNHKAKAGQNAILRHVDSILAAKAGIASHSSELAASAQALGQLGDPDNLGVVRRICRYFSEPVEGAEPPGIRFPCIDVFVAYHGLSHLGEKEQALVELKRLYEKYSAQMDDSSRRYTKKASMKHERGGEDASRGEGSKGDLHQIRGGERGKASSVLPVIPLRFGLRFFNPFRKLLEKPEIRSDSGSCYISREFGGVLDEHELSHRRIKPHCPEENGLMERANRTIDEALEGERRRLWPRVTAFALGSQCG